MNAQLDSVDFRTQADSNNCTPLARYFAYKYVFAGPKPKGLRTTARHFSVFDFADASFVTINGKYVVCSRPPVRVLMKVNNTPDFTLSCVEKL